MAEIPSPFNTCPQAGCGYRNAADATFCAGCGKPLTTSSGHGQATTRAQTQGMALGFLLGGALCMYFGFSLGARAPINSTDPNWWYSIDNGLFLGLRVVGGFLLLAGVIALAGQRIGLLVGALGEFGLGGLALCMAIFWAVRGYVAGEFDVMVILLLVVAGMSIAAGLRCARALRVGG